MKRLLSALLALCLTLACCAAQAAPARDMQPVQVEIDPGMRMLVETVLGAAVYTDIRGLEENMAPSPALAEAALAMGLYNLSLPHEGGAAAQGAAKLSNAEAGPLVALLFAAGDYAIPQAASVSGVTVKDGALEIDLAALQAAPMVGAYIYAAAVTEGEDDVGAERVDLAADLYAYYGDFGMEALDLPEDALTWLCNAEISLERAPDTAYGWKVRGYALSDAYEDGTLADWQAVDNDAAQYSVNVPSALGLAEDDPMHLTWQSAEGGVTLRIDVEALDGRSAQQVLAAYQAENPEREIVRQEEFCMYYTLGEGDYRLWVISEGLGEMYCVSMQFPARRQAEYALYSEFIRNSMIVWGISNG